MQPLYIFASKLIGKLILINYTQIYKYEINYYNMVQISTQIGSGVDAKYLWQLPYGTIALV